MSRQNRNSVRGHKSEAPKRDIAGNNDRYSRSIREESVNTRERNQDRNNMPAVNGLDKYRLNDLYERSSI